MSVLKIRNHNENIYTVADVPPPKPSKPSRHDSKFSRLVRAELQSGKSGHRTMGFAEVPLNEPENFLRKSGGVRHQQPKSAPVRLCQSRRPPVPKRSEVKSAARPTCCCGAAGDAEDKNFRVDNIKRMISAEAKRPRPKICDTRRGDCQDLQKSGLLPVYVHKNKFGKVPPYLEKMKKMLAARAEAEEVAKPAPKCNYVSQEERNEILNGLKHNWQQLQTEYQKLSILTDTLPKKLRKTKLENQLKQYERDIMLLERSPNIYIYEDGAR